MESIDPKLFLDAARAIKDRLQGSAEIRSVLALPRPQKLSTGLLSLDAALVDHGLLPGSIVEIFGSPQVGKTSLALRMTKSAQGMGRGVGWIDADFKLERRILDRMKVLPEELVIGQPESGEESIELAGEMLREFPLVVIDSVASLVSKATLKGADIPAHMEYVHLFGRLCKMAERAAWEGRSVLVLVNQVRARVASRLGERLTSAGSFMTKPHANIRIQIGAYSSMMDTTSGFILHNGGRSRMLSTGFERGEIDEVLDLVLASRTLGVLERQALTKRELYQQLRRYPDIERETRLKVLQLLC